MTKLLQILYPGLGGHSSVAFSLIEADEQNEYQHYLLGYGIESPTESFVTKAIEMNVNFDSVLKLKGLDIKSQFQIFKLLKKKKPDIILMHGTSLVFIVWIYCNLYRKKWVAVEHEPNYAKEIKDWIFSFFILLLAPQIVYLTPQYKEEINKKFHFIPSKKISIIANGVNLEKFKKVNFKSSSKDKNETITISMMSRMNALRDHKTLIDAFNMLSINYPNTELRIAGDGDTKQKYEEYAAKLNLRTIYFLGLLNEDEIIDLLNTTDIYVHSSLKETLSTSLLQTMACQVPIIATDIDGINNLLMDETDALLFQPKNAKQLADKIRIIIESPELKDKIVKNAYEKVKMKYSNKSMFEQYKSLFNS